MGKKVGKDWAQLSQPVGVQMPYWFGRYLISAARCR
jgi:hypothetical protein